MAELEEAVRGDLQAQGLAPDAIGTAAIARLRFEGSDTTLGVPVGPPEQMAATFRAEHQRRFGWSDDAAPILLDALRVEGTGCDDAFAAALAAAGGSDDRTCVTGPATIAQEGSSVIVEPGWQAERQGDVTLLLQRASATVATLDQTTRRDPLRLALFGNLFMAIASEMGSVLEATARSVNIKERLDFSCALFDADGALIANAPHIPVHLGSMSASIAEVIANRRSDGRGIRAGDAYCLNDPYAGGTHLPDITVIVPVFLEGEQAPFAWVAARGHHADIGGIAPGSMPPGSIAIEEEGIRLADVLLADEGRFAEARLRAMLAAGPYPARNIDANIADLKAQLAACARGAALLQEAAATHSPAVVTAYMAHALDHGEEVTRALSARLEGGSFTYPMDNGAEVSVTVTPDADAGTITVDFTGTSAQLPSNFNAPEAISRAAVLYCLRLLSQSDMPLNDGCLRPVHIVLPDGSMLSPRPPAAVVAGNVETSQVITDAILASVGAMAPSQGTMNNLTFGNAKHQYYETIAGGSGAGPGFAGADGVQTHMTNSRLTDPEVLEHRLPVLVERFAVRTGSGGDGRWHGGEGTERVLRFTQGMEVQILANRRIVPPRGIAGGGDGATGETFIRRVEGSIDDLGSTGSARVRPGDDVVIRTPGGGGYGAP